MYFLMTVDVEIFSIALNRYDPDIATNIYIIGLPRLLDLLSKHDVCGTFYFSGELCEVSPESIELVRAYGHEIGCHGYNHIPYRAFDVLSYEEQVAEIQKAKNVIEPIAGRITSFRAPALRINKHTVRALEDTGFTSDSSVSSQRFDGPFTFGAKNKLKWLIAPRKPYFISYSSFIRPGNSSVLEIPVSAALVPFTGTSMRLAPLLTKILQKFLYVESKKDNKPVVFLFHPHECLELENRIIATRRTNSFVEYIFADKIRQRVKLRNLGLHSLRLLDNILADASQNGFEFISVGQYRKKY
jgi:peptidoglycan/xylan/chitin deacetylase (PgdA/CDA1 family)